MIQRGNDRQTIVRDDDDRQLLVDLLGQYAREHRVSVHSYVVMDNHLHLLATPEAANGLPAMMQAVGRRYVRIHNNRHKRTGTLWEGRYRSTLVQAERYLLACMVYIDLNPVRAAMVEAATDYRWSSCRHYAGLVPDRLVTPHPLFWELGNTPFAREEAYRNLLGTGLELGMRDRLTDATVRGWALGDDDYLNRLTQGGTRRPSPTSRGRPKRKIDLSPNNESQGIAVKKMGSDPI